MTESHNDNTEIKFGQFLVENNIITQNQLEEALELQKDNKERLVGEILVTLGILSKEDIIMALEGFLVYTGIDVNHVDEWLDQDEIDMLMNRLKNNKSKSS